MTLYQPQKFLKFGNLDERWSIFVQKHELNLPVIY